MPNEPSKDTSLFPHSDGVREDSGLQDILAVAAKIKEKPASTDTDDSDGDDSGMILFTAGPDDGGSSEADDDALFGSFAGGLDLAAPDSLAAEVTASASASSLAEPPKAELAPAKQEEGGSNKALVAVVAVLGLAIVGLGGVYMLGDKDKPADQQAQAAPADDGAAAKAKEPEPELEPEAGSAGASAGAAAVEPDPDEFVEDEVVEEVDTEGLGAMGEDAGDPMGMREDLLAKKDSPVAKVGKWDQGESNAKPAKSDPAPAELPDPDPDPILDPLPEPKSAGNKKVTEEDVDCLLNPDLPKCGKDTGPKKPQHEVLAPKLPDKLSSKQLRDGFASVKPQAKKCGLKHGVPPGTKVKVHVSIEGASGKVSSVKATGEHAGTPLGTCVENTAKNAQFQQFKKPAMGIDYPLIM